MWTNSLYAPIRRSSSCRSGFGSSLFNGSVKIDESGSGGHKRSVKGFRDTASGAARMFEASSASSIFVSVSTISVGFDGSKEGGGDDGPASALLDIIQSPAIISSVRLCESLHTFVSLVAGD